MKKFNFKKSEEIVSKEEYGKPYIELQEMEKFLVDSHVADLASQHYNN